MIDKQQYFMVRNETCKQLFDIYSGEEKIAQWLTFEKASAIILTLNEDSLETNQEEVQV